MNLVTRINDTSEDTEDFQWSKAFENSCSVALTQMDLCAIDSFN